MQERKQVNASGSFPAEWAKRMPKEAKTSKRGETAMEDFKLPHQHGEGKQMARLRECFNHIEYFQTAAEMFKHLDDPTRIRIFWLLCHCEECVINISAMLNMSSPAVSHHLRPLRNSGLIASRRAGKEVYYRAADTKESRLLHQMIEQTMRITCPDMGGEKDE